jgi:hypothetical protein
MPEVVIDPDVLDGIKTKLVSLSKTWETGVTRGQSFRLNGEYFAGRNYDACHAWVPSTYSELCDINGYSWDRGFWSLPYGKNAQNFLVASCHSKQRSKGICSAKAHEEIILWLASDDNPMSEYIVNRDDKESLLNGGIIILCGPDGANMSETMWMCKVLRYAVESGQSLDVWLKLKNGGVDAMLALFVSTFIRSVKGATFKYTGSMSHVSVFGADDNRVYGEGTKEFGSLMTRKVNKKASCTAELFSKPKFKKSLSTEGSTLRIEKFCKPVKVDDGWGGTVEGSAATANEFIENVVQWQKEIMLNLELKE